jgi:hypothetical protein
VLTEGDVFMAWCLVKNRDNFTFIMKLSNYEALEERIRLEGWQPVVICMCQLCQRQLCPLHGGRQVVFV